MSKRKTGGYTPPANKGKGKGKKGGVTKGYKPPKRPRPSSSGDGKKS